MKKISFWIVIFICMADAALAVTQEGGLFYLPEDTTMQHKDSTVQKRTFSKSFWTILMMLIKIRIIRNLISVLLADHITVRIPNWGWDWWRRGFIVPIEMTCFFLHPMCLYSEMFPLLASICWGYAELISFRRTNTGWIILFIFIPFLPSFGE